MVICLHQIDKSRAIFFAREGCGNCVTCIPDEKNKDCLFYVPISISVFEVLPMGPSTQNISREANFVYA